MCKSGVFKKSRSDSMVSYTEFYRQNATPVNHFLSLISPVQLELAGSPHNPYVSLSFRDDPVSKRLLHKTEDLSSDNPHLEKS